MEKVIKIKCKGSRSVRISSLKTIQGDLKLLSPENEGKLRARIEKLGFDAPIFVWKNKILDGTQRLRVLEKMLTEGWTLPKGEVPVCDIIASSLAEAKERLLGYVSQYGKIDFEGLKDFTDGIAVDFGTLDLPDFDLDKFLNFDPLDAKAEWGGMPEFVQEDKGSYRDIVVHFPDKKSVTQFAKLVNQTITEKTKYIWYPQNEIVSAIDEEIKSES